MTDRPKDLRFRKSSLKKYKEALCEEQGPNNSHDSSQVELIISPILSVQSSTSSVNERQRKLSETVFDWVFDESDSYKTSDVSEGTPSTIDDGEN